VLLAFAGLYTWWPDKSLPEDHPDYWTLTATILTRAAVGAVSDLHEHTPVTLPPNFWNEWLDTGQDGNQSLVDAAVAAATPVAEALEFYQVGPLKGDGPDFLTPVEPNHAKCSQTTGRNYVGEAGPTLPHYWAWT
jgi:putative SOS response-associated peptidase YedK